MNLRVGLRHQICGFVLAPESFFNVDCADHMTFSAKSPFPRSRRVMIVTAVVLLCCIVCVGGCSVRRQPLPGRPETSQSQVASRDASTAAALESRAQQYWERRQAKDLTASYSYYCLEYRSRIPQAQYLQLTRLARFDLMEVRVVGIEGSGNRLQVTVAFRIVLPKLVGQVTNGQTSEMWARGSNGEWCKEDEPLILPFPSSSGSLPSAPMTGR